MTELARWVGKTIDFLSPFWAIMFKLLYHDDEEPEIEAKNIKEILIYGHMGIGNMILFTPTIKAIRKCFLKARITLLVGGSGAEKVVEGSGLIDEVIKFKLDKAVVINGLNLIRKIRKGKFDLLFTNFHGAHLSPLTILSGIPYRVGHVISPGWRSKFDYVYNFKVVMGQDEHEIDRDIRLVQAIDVKEEEIDRSLVVWIGEEEREYATQWLHDNNITSDDVVIGVQVGTSPAQQWKQWRLDRYAEVCDKLIGDDGAKIMLLGSPNEAILAEYVKGKMKYTPIIATGGTTIKQAAAIVEKCHLLICNDSGLMHVAAAIGTPVVAIYGPTDYHRTAPYGNKHIILRKDLPCSPCFRMSGTKEVESCKNRECFNLISVEDVLQAVASQLSGSYSRSDKSSERKTISRVQISTILSPKMDK